jgi:hypothetical protein
MVFWTGPPEDQGSTVSDSHGSEFYAAWVLGAALVVFGVSSGYFVPYTVRGTDLVSARVSSLAPPAPPIHGTKVKK